MDKIRIPILLFLIILSSLAIGISFYTYKKVMEVNDSLGNQAETFADVENQLQALADRIVSIGDGNVIKGEQGEKGEKGDPGEDGEDGAPGTTGSVGAQGEKGNPGISGYERVCGDSATVKIDNFGAAHVTCPSGKKIIAPYCMNITGWYTFLKEIYISNSEETVECEYYNHGSPYPVTVIACAICGIVE